jgi:uncharacterized phage-associated protein
MVRETILGFLIKFFTIKAIIKRNNKYIEMGDKFMNKEGTYDAIDIAQYVINYSIDKGKPIINLKLQKLLYYIQAAFLVEKNIPCFKEKIINWRHGPVVEEVYDKYKDYVDDMIDDKQYGYYDLILDKEKFKFKANFIEFHPDKISDDDKRLINKVVDSFADFNAWELVERTHNENPWKVDSNRNEIISNESIKRYFEENKDRIYVGT